MRHLPDSQRRCASDVSDARLLALLLSDPLLRESLTLLPPVLLVALLHIHTQVGWDACFAAMRQLNHEHGRHMRELSTALSMLRSLRGTRMLDPLVWHAAARRVMHAIAGEFDALNSTPARTGFARVARGRSARRSRALHALWHYWLAARTSAPVSWL